MQDDTHPREEHRHECRRDEEREKACLVHVIHLLPNLEPNVLECLSRSAVEVSCKAIVAVSGYLITNLKANLQPQPPAAELGWWYQYYFATERGRLGYDKNRYEFNKLI